MGRKNKSYYKDLHQQAYDVFNAMLSFGESKKKAVEEETDKKKIFSLGLSSKLCKFFVEFCKTAINTSCVWS